MIKTEVEIKFRVKNPRAFRDKLKSIGAEFIKKELEKDCYFGQCRENGSGLRNTLRLRKFKNGGLISIKGPLLKSKFKKKKEVEVKIDDPIAMAEFLYKIGFVEIETSKKEKLRETYLYKKNISIFLDKLPFIGYYTEIEGSSGDIEKTAKALSLDMKDSIKESYSELFSYYLTVQRAKNPQRKVKSFTFSSE